MRSPIWNDVIPPPGRTPSPRDRRLGAALVRGCSAHPRFEGSTAEVTGHLSSILSSAFDDKRLLRNRIKEHRSQASAAYGEEGQGLEPVRRRRGPPRPPGPLLVRSRPRTRTRPAPGRSLRPGVRGLRLGGRCRIRPASAQVGHQGKAVLLPPQGRQPEPRCPSPSPLPAFPVHGVYVALAESGAPGQRTRSSTAGAHHRALVLMTSHGNRIYYRTWNDQSWKSALAAAGLITAVGEKVRRNGGRIRRVPVYAAQREDMSMCSRNT